MSTLVDQIIKAGYAKHIVTQKQIASIIGGSEARRYGLVNRALKDGSLVRLKRGLYILGQGHSGGTIHPFAVAQAMLAGSYISFESALSYHGWIPEAVYATASITPHRKSLTYTHDQFGLFAYSPLAINKYHFLTGVERIKVGNHHILVAKPLRALMDLIAYRKVSWIGIEWIEQGLRIDRDLLLKLCTKDFHALKLVYKHETANTFLVEFERAVPDLKGDEQAPAVYSETPPHD